MTSLRSYSRRVEPLGAWLDSATLWLIAQNWFEDNKSIKVKNLFEEVLGEAYRVPSGVIQLTSSNVLKIIDHCLHHLSPSATLTLPFPKLGA